MLAGATLIEIFGFGASAIVEMDGQQKSPLFGVPCRAKSDPHHQIMTASMVGPGDVVVVISYTGRTRQIVEAAEVARANGAKVMGLVGMEGPVSAVCDVTLVVETLDNTNVYTPTTSRIAAVVLIDILSTAVALRRGYEQTGRLDRMDRRLSAFRSGDAEEPSA